MTKNTHYLISVVLSICLAYLITTKAYAADTSLRRPISNNSPAWLVHIDVWVDADPVKIIKMIPEDIRPFVIFNISLSASSPGSGPYGQHVNTPTIAESWLRTCAEYGVWAIIQPASGYINNLPYTQSADDIYEHFYKTYPNFLGYNFCEQCWGFPNELAIDERASLFSNLIKLSNKYGGYLFVSYTQTMNAPNTNGVAFLKRSRSLRTSAKNFSENFVMIEKYTTSRGFYDIESTTLGPFLTGYCDNYGIRFDACGWTYIPVRDQKSQFPEALGIVPIVEHALLTGQTVTDGPELTWTLMSIGRSGVSVSDGYSSKNFNFFPNFTNNNMDVFRKILDGSFRIPDREEVIARTKVAFLNDVTTGDHRNQFSSEKTLFTGLYGVDGEYDFNHNWTKSSGRYPSIPTVPGGVSGTLDEAAILNAGFEHVIKKSTYNDTWPNINTKLEQLQTLFPEEYTGDIYAGRIKNTWVTYNPYMGQMLHEGKENESYELLFVPASGTIPFKYNTCEKMDIKHDNYGLSVIHEFNNRLEVYLNNYCSKVSGGIPLLRDDVIKVYGSKEKPTYTFTNRGDSESGAVTITDSWENGVFTLTINHNGPLDLVIQCEGHASDRLTDYPEQPTIISPPVPPVYIGTRQYEFEDFAYKSISRSKSTDVAGYTALGYSIFGSNTNASVRKDINALNAGNHKLTIKYISSSSIALLDLYINNTKVKKISLAQTKSGEWSLHEEEITLSAGNNLIEFKANRASNTLLLDYMLIEDASINELPVIQQEQGKSVLYQNYYDMLGRKVQVSKLNELKGFYIIQSKMSDGSVLSEKKYFK